MIDRLNKAVYQSRRSAIREFSALAGNTPGCVALTLGEPDFDTPEPVITAAWKAMKNGETHYIANNGDRALLEKISAYEATVNHLHYSADEIIVTTGATEALFTALFGILNPGDEVIIPTPAFGLYEQIVLLCRAVPVFLDTSEDDFEIDETKLNALITERTKAVIINSPNNPSGCVYTSGSLEGIYRILKEKQIFAVCDDVYRQLIYTDDFHSFAEYEDIRDRIIVVQSFSKPYAMTGWRMGYLMMDGVIKERLELIHQYVVVSTPAMFQKACMCALDCDISQMKETYRKRRAYVMKRLTDMGLIFREPEGGFYVFPSIEKYGMSSDVFCRRLITEGGLALTPGSCFGCEGHVRLTYCYADEQLKEGLDRLERFLAELEGKNP
ncbi:MAG: pyridoxal phosphate-dependent aminotransferase [Bulleidia sp.]